MLKGKQLTRLFQCYHESCTPLAVHHGAVIQAKILLLNTYNLQAALPTKRQPFFRRREPAGGCVVDRHAVTGPQECGFGGGDAETLDEGTFSLGRILSGVTCDLRWTWMEQT